MIETLPPLIDTDDLLDITLHKYQEEALFSKARITALISGIQGGKTRIGGLWMANRIVNNDAANNTFIVATPTYKLQQKSTLPWMLSLLKGCGYLDKQKNAFILNGGATLYFASMQDSDSVEGATNVQGIWIDEAGKIRYSAWVNLYARTSYTQCPIFITTTPYSLNWLYKEVYLPWARNERQDIKVVQFRSIDNPYFPKEEYEKQKNNLDPRIFEMKYGGTFQRMAGLVYNDLDEKNYIEKHIPSKAFFDYYAGVDIGYTNPMAIALRAIKKDGSQDIQFGEFYKSFLNPVERTNILKQYHQKYGFKQVYVDSANPDDIALFATAGIPVTAVKKGPKSVQFGIELHQEIIKSKIYRIIPEYCPYTMDEYNTYHYEEHEDEHEHEIKEEPAKIKDHLMDANRYCTMMTVTLRNKANAPYKCTPTHLQQLLKGKFKQHNQGCEDWYEN